MSEWWEKEADVPPLEPRGPEPQFKRWAICDAAGRVIAVRTRLIKPPVDGGKKAHEVVEDDVDKYMRDHQRPKRIDKEGKMVDLEMSMAEHRAMRKHAIEREYARHMAARYPTDKLALLGHKEEVKAYVRKLRKEVSDKKKELDDAGDSAALDAVAWDLKQFDADDPKLTIDDI